MTVLKIVEISEEDIDRVKKIFDRKNLYKILIDLDEAKYVDDWIQASKEYTAFFREMSVQFNLDDNSQMSIDFGSKMLTSYIP